MDVVAVFTVTSPDGTTYTQASSVTLISKRQPKKTKCCELFRKQKKT